MMSDEELDTLHKAYERREIDSERLQNVLRDEVEIPAKPVF